MKKIGCLLLILAALVCAAAALLILPIFGRPAPTDFATHPDLATMLASVPADARQIILIPSFGSAWHALSSHPSTSEVVESVAGDIPSALPYLVGNGDVVV